MWREILAFEAKDVISYPKLTVPGNRLFISCWTDLVPTTIPACFELFLDEKSSRSVEKIWRQELKHMFDTPKYQHRL